jgi:hypothetical protein
MVIYEWDGLDDTHLTRDNEDLVLLGSHDGFSDRTADTTGPTCYCYTDHCCFRYEGGT